MIYMFYGWLALFLVVELFLHNRDRKTARKFTAYLLSNYQKRAKEDYDVSDNMDKLGKKFYSQLDRQDENIEDEEFFKLKKNARLAHQISNGWFWLGVILSAGLIIWSIKS